MVNMGWGEYETYLLTYVAVLYYMCEVVVVMVRLYGIYKYRHCYQIQ